MRRMAMVLAAVALLGAYGCGDDDDGAGEAVATQDGTEVVAVAETSLGSVLVDAEGRTLYLFTEDVDGTSTCTDDCAQAWPPLLAPDGPLTAGEGADPALLATVEREDGTLQVTYAGHPLYTYAADAAPGDVNGQGVGDVWFVVAPDGSAVTPAADVARPGY